MGDDENRVHLSADRSQDCAFIQSVEQSCVMPELIDPVEYIKIVNIEQKMKPLTAASSFSQFKQVFVGSPRGRDASDKEVGGDYEDPCKYERLQKLYKKAKKPTSYVSAQSSGVMNRDNSYGQSTAETILSNVKVAMNTGSNYSLRNHRKKRCEDFLEFSPEIQSRNDPSISV